VPYPVFVGNSSFRDISNEIKATTTYNGRVIQNIMSVRCRKCEEELDNSNAEIWEHFYSVHIDDIDPRRAFSEHLVIEE